MVHSCSYCFVALVGVFVGATVILNATGAPSDVTLAVLLGVGIPVVLLLGLPLIMPALRYKMYIQKEELSEKLEK